MECLLVDMNVNRFRLFGGPALLVGLAAAKEIERSIAVTNRRFDSHHQADIPGSDFQEFRIDPRLV